MSEKFVPFSEVADATDGRLIVGYSGMPDSVPHNLSLNVGALHSSIIKFGGFETTRFSGHHGGGDNHSVSLGDVDASGISTMSTVITTIAESSESSITSDQERNTNSLRNGTLDIQWNIDALNSRLRTSDQYDPQKRAKQLDRVIRERAIRGVWRHNTVDYIRDSESSTLDNLVSDIVGPLLGMTLTGTDTKGIIASYTLSRIIWLAGATYTNRAERGNQILDPLLSSARPTRALAATAILSTRQLVKATGKTH